MFVASFVSVTVTPGMTPLGSRTSPRTPPVNCCALTDAAAAARSTALRRTPARRLIVSLPDEKVTRTRSCEQKSEQQECNDAGAILGVAAGRAQPTIHGKWRLRAKPPFLWISLVSALLRLELDPLEDHRFLGKLRRSRGKLVRVEQEREDVGVLLTAEAPRRILRHRDSYPLEEIADAQAVPVGLEIAADQRRRHLAARQLRPVARRARVGVQLLAALGLFVRVDAVSHRFVLRVDRHGRAKHEDHCERNQRDRCKLKLHDSPLYKTLA